MIPDRGMKRSKRIGGRREGHGERPMRRRCELVHPRRWGGSGDVGLECVSWTSALHDERDSARAARLCGKGPPRLAEWVIAIASRPVADACDPRSVGRARAERWSRARNGRKGAPSPEGNMEIRGANMTEDAFPTRASLSRSDASRARSPPTVATALSWFANRA